MTNLNVYNVYWYPRVGFDCEKENTYVFAKTSRDAVNLRYFDHVLVAEVRPVTGQEEKDARKYGWCINDRNRI